MAEEYGVDAERTARRAPVVRVVVGVLVAVLGGLSAVAAVGGSDDDAPAAGTNPAGGPQDLWGPVVKLTGPDAPGEELTLRDGEVVPVLGAWVSARITDDAGTTVWVGVGSTDATRTDGTFRESTVSQEVPAGARFLVQAWASITVQRASPTAGTIDLRVVPAPVDADNPGGVVVAGFEPGTTKFDGVWITVGACVGERTADLWVTSADAVLVERAQAAPGDTWDVPGWRRMTVLGVDNAYAGDGCRVVVELASPGT